MAQNLAHWLMGASLIVAVAAGRSVHAEEIDVVVSIKPVHSLVAGAMQGVNDPVLLVKGTGSEHSYSLRPSEARSLQDADVVFWVGEKMETFLIKPLQALAGDAKIVELGKVPGLTLLPTREGGMWETHEHGDERPDADADRGEDEHAEEHGNQGQRAEEHQEGQHADADHEGAEDHAHGETDMHIWLDPANAKVLVAAIATTLSDADPQHASTYQANAARLLVQLDELDRSLRHGLANVADRPYVVFHDAYHYFEHRYGLKAVGTITINPTVRPSVQRLQEIHERLEHLDAACVFAEPQFEPALVDTVIEGTNAKKGVLDPLGAALPDGPDQYFLLMNGLAHSLIDCLSTAQAG
jgi:zinc transport system substrate-binding protein